MATRFDELDSLRGLAACTVVLTHFWDGMDANIYLATFHSPLRILVAGHNAVTLFFVLSGFVLFIICILKDHLTLVYLPIYLVTVLILSSIFYYLIEKPSMLLGRRLGKVLG
jgi:peptidoglycan/LPS O-acetylase OafA/YrhL